MAEERQGAIGYLVARVLGGVGLVAGALLVLEPFLVPMAWAAIIAYATWPLFRAVRTRSKRPRVAAAIFTAAVAIGAGVPVAWILVALANEAAHLISVVRGWLDAGAPLPDWLASYPGVAERIARLRSQPVLGPTDFADVASRYGAQVSSNLLDVARGIARNALKFGITMVTLYVFYLDGEQILHHARRLATVVFPAAPKQLLDDVGGVVRSVVFGLLGTALVQGVLAGIGFAIFGVPSAVALGAFTAAASFIPFGPALVWGAAAVWLFVSDAGLGSVIGMVVWGALFVSSIDNILRPLLISSGPTPIPFLLVFAGVLGGLSAFGMLGLFVGPVLLSVTFALIVEFPRLRLGER